MPEPYHSTVEILAAAALEAPDAQALVCGGERLSYGEYARCAAGLAGELTALGAAGGRVALVLGNSVDICIAIFAIHAAQAQAVPLNPLYTARELREILADAEPHVLMFDAEKRDVPEPLADELGIPHAWAVGKGGRRLSQWRDDESAILARPYPDPSSFATLQYTGGTTGRAKGVNLSHGAIAANIRQWQGVIPTRPEIERLLCVMPLFHVYAASMMYNMVYSRSCLVILERYDAAATLATFARDAITIFAGSPTLFTGLIAHVDFGKTDFSSLYFCYSGSAPLPEDLCRRWQRATGAPVLEGYGQTECGPIVSFNPLAGPHKPGSVGIALPDTEIEIVDLETGAHVLPIGEAGEIRVRGPQIMAGYRNLPDETAATLQNGWLHTTDIGEFDEDGYLYIRDRKKEMVLVSGYNVFPREIEEVLHRHGGVLEAAVVGVPHPYKGEAVVAAVVPRAGAALDNEVLTDFCRGQLAPYKVPSRFEIMAALPKTGVGKIDKAALRACLAPLHEKMIGEKNAERGNR